MGLKAEAGEKAPGSETHQKTERRGRYQPPSHPPAHRPGLANRACFIARLVDCWIFDFGFRIQGATESQSSQ